MQAADANNRWQAAADRKWEGEEARCTGGKTAHLPLRAPGPLPRPPTVGPLGGPDPCLLATCRCNNQMYVEGERMKAGTKTRSRLLLLAPAAHLAACLGPATAMRRYPGSLLALVATLRVGAAGVVPLAVPAASMTAA
jgi:hypothetical protein